ncbi:MAG TPA: Holliday junction branch migration protein RuvA [Bryobacteraceae bacterium]|nr:Holliday junction branch migration protein RuvA [Bryobacteraceae bacterium]
MIAHLRGSVLEKHPNQVIVEAGGVGYEVHIPVSTFTRLPDVGAEAKLRIHMHVREDAMVLYGFHSPEEKLLFEKLITVSGIGPKVALTALSGIALVELVQAIRTGDVVQLTRIPGVGKKTAERMVVELRDKVDIAVAGVSVAVVSQEKGGLLTELDLDLISALTNLGSQRPAAEAAVRKARATLPEGDFEALFRKAMELVR